MKDITKAMTMNINDTYRELYSLSNNYTENFSLEHEIQHILYKGFKKATKTYIESDNHTIKGLLEERDRLLIELQGYRQTTNGLV